MQNLFKRLLFISILFVSINISAQETPSNNTIKDSTVLSNLKKSSTSSINGFQDKLMLETELEHQKLIRNIFALSFIFLFAALMFIIFFYGSKVKKINELIILQNDYMNSAKDQLQKIIAVFNYIDQFVIITGAKGVVEWANSYALNEFRDDYEKNKISFLEKFSTDSQGKIFQAINNNTRVQFSDNMYKTVSNWKAIPIANSKGEFSNLVFIGY